MIKTAIGIIELVLIVIGYVGIWGAKLDESLCLSGLGNGQEGSVFVVVL